MTYIFQNAELLVKNQVNLAEFGSVRKCNYKWIINALSIVNTSRKKLQPQNMQVSIF